MTPPRPLACATPLAGAARRSTRATRDAPGRAPAARGPPPERPASHDEEPDMTIKTATLNGVATIEIARPEKKNALTVAMYQAMADALTRRRPTTPPCARC